MENMIGNDSLLQDLSTDDMVKIDGGKPIIVTGADGTIIIIKM